MVGGRITFERAAHAGDATTIEGWVLPGLVDVHCHIGVTAGGAADDGARREAGRGGPRHGRPADPGRGKRDGHLVGARAATTCPASSARAASSRDPSATSGASRASSTPSTNSRPRPPTRRGAGDGWVKLIADWIDRDLGDDGDLTPLWPDDVLADAVAAAHAEGARVTAHTFATESIDGLLARGSTASSTAPA